MSVYRKPLVYMAELTYDSTVISNEYFPIAIGYIVGYSQEQLPDTFTYRLFNFPGELLNALDSKPPDILGLSYFPWNNNLSLMVADYYIERKPNGIVVFGGGDLPIEPQRRVQFFMKNRNVDIFVLYDGEFGFSEILKRYLENDGNKKKMLSERSIDGCIYWNQNMEEIREGEIVSRSKNFDEIPSPYLNGLMDPYFENQQLTPRIQSTRGCPFGCAYCWSSCDYSSQVRHFSVERTLTELDYIAQRRKRATNRSLIFCDTNFGMYSKDEIIADKIGILQEKYNFPSNFDAPGGKSNRDRVIKIMKRVKNSRANVSVQSTDPNILRNVKRKPVTVDEYREIVHQFHSFGIPVISEIITGLPGETRDTHMQTLKDLIDIGVDEIDPFTLMFLEGTELTSQESQAQNQWDKRFRIIPRNFGKYRGRICFEIETVGVGSNTYTFDDYMYLRGLHGALKIIFNNAFFREFTKWLKQAGIEMFSFCLTFYENICDEPGPAGKQFRAYLKETREEIWESREELENFFLDEENFQRLFSGEIGDNLLVKYKAIMACDNFDAWCNFLYAQAMKAVDDRMTQDMAIELLDIRNHVMAKAYGILTEKNMSGKSETISLNYNVSAWLKDNYTRPLSAYKLKRPSEFVYSIQKENMRLVEEILSLGAGKSSMLWKAVGNRYFLPALFRKAEF